MVEKGVDADAMKLRTVSCLLWFLAGWGVAGTVAINLGLSQMVGPLVGVAWAALVIVDPKDVVWRVGKGSTKAKREASSNAVARPQVGVGS
jgi:hypothetical protein